MSRSSTCSALIAVASLAACAPVDSSPAKPQVAASERQQAARQHPQILGQFGGASNGSQADYVARVGQKIAVAAGLPGQCTFTLVNTDVVNAFAVPGCYVYVTRGLLGIVNSEAELASILGHEVGHVVADHSDRRWNTSVLTGLGSLAVGVLTGSSDLAQLAGQAGQLYTLSYSREQEYESDDLGIRYLVRAGYDPYAAADMLESLQNHDRLQARTRGRDEAESVPEWARTHPLTSERVARATGQARATGVAPDTLPEQEAAYLAAVDGLLYGDDPAQGYIEGRRFAHPMLSIAFEVPVGFSLTNTPQAVVIDGPNGVRAQFGSDGMPTAGLAEYGTSVMRAVLGQAAGNAQVGEARRTTVNGLETVVLPARAVTPQGSLDVTVAAYRVDNRGYHFVTLAPSGASAERAIDAMIRSFRMLSSGEAAALRPRRIAVVTVRAGDTINSLANRMAFDQLRVERFLMLNDRMPEQPLRPGERVKLVIYGLAGATGNQPV